MSTGADCIERADDFIIIQFQRFFDADEHCWVWRVFLLQNGEKKGILEAFAENPSDLIQFALVKKKCHEKFSFISRKEDLDFKSATSEARPFFTFSFVQLR